MKYTISKVTTKQQLDDFVKLPRTIYKDSPYYVPDLESDIRKMFFAKTNPSLDNARIQLFVAYDENGKPVGRIEGIINDIANDTWNTKNVRFGMIEFIDDNDVSRLLLEAVEKWGKEQGMTKIEGPLGITDFDKEGMLMSDFDEKGSIVTIYNHEYYPRHMEKLGFSSEADWVQLKFDLPGVLPERFQRVANIVKQKFGYRVIKVTRRDIYEGGYGKRIFNLFNEAYKPLFGFSKLSDKQIRIFVDQYLRVLDLRLMPVILDKEGRLVGVAVCMGSLTEALQKANGRLLPFGWYHLLKALYWKREKKVEMILIAVDPKLQGMGVNALFFDDLLPVMQKMKFEWVEAAPQLESNHKVLSQWEPFHPTLYKHRRCWGKSI